MARPRDIAFTRTAIRQLAGLRPAQQAYIREILAAYADDPTALDLRADGTRHPPIVWLSTQFEPVALVAGDNLVAVLRLGVEIDPAVTVLGLLATGQEERVAERNAARLMRGENAVKVWREHRGVTQSELAKEAGITLDYLSKIETGRRQPSDEVKSDLLHALAVDVLDFGFLIDVPGRKKPKKRRR